MTQRAIDTYKHSEIVLKKRSSLFIINKDEYIQSQQDQKLKAFQPIGAPSVSSILHPAHSAHWWRELTVGGMSACIFWNWLKHIQSAVHEVCPLKQATSIRSWSMSLKLAWCLPHIRITDRSRDLKSSRLLALAMVLIFNAALIWWGRFLFKQGRMKSQCKVNKSMNRRVTACQGESSSAYIEACWEMLRFHLFFFSALNQY